MKLAEEVQISPVIKQTEFKIIKDESLLELPEYIDRPEYVQRKSAGYGLMALGWMLWMWLFLPVLTLLFWWFEGNVVYAHITSQTEPMTSISIMKLITTIGLFICGLFLWASYNWVRFDGEDRRKAPENASDKDLAHSFDVKANDIVSMRQSKNITLHYSEEGQLERYHINS